MPAGNIGVRKGLAALAMTAALLVCPAFVPSADIHAMEVRIGADPVKTQGRSGGINYQKTMDAVQDLGGNTVRLMIKHDYQLNTLESYLQNFKPLMVSPNLSGAPTPYGRDMKAWAKYFGELWQQYVP